MDQQETAPRIRDSAKTMAPAYHIASDDGLISIRIGNEIDLVDLYELAKALLGSDDYDPELPLVMDLRGMRLDLVREAIEPFSRFAIEHFRNRPASIAVVIDHEMNRELVAGIYWLACAVGGTEVFDDYDQALKWLIRREFAHESPPNVVQLADHRPEQTASGRS